MGIRPATPGTLVVAVATVLLSLVSASTPVMKSIWFLKAHINVKIQSVTVGGDVKLGTFGYCIIDDCVGPKLGYSIEASSLLNIGGTAEQLLGSLPTTLIKWLTYALVIHPVAAAFAGLATICGLLSHIREFSITGFTTCFAVFGAILSLLAFIFDVIAFSIAKSRINSTGSDEDSVSANAQLGNGIWMTLAAFVLLLFSGCFFSFGRCVIRSKANRKSGENDKWKPSMDPTFNNQMREDGLAAEKWRKDGSTANSSFRKGKEGGLPAFAESDQEHVPLTHFHQWEQDDEERVSGVGYGAPRNHGHYPNASYGSDAYGSDVGAYSAGYAAGYYQPQQPQQARREASNGLPANASSFSSMYDNGGYGSHARQGTYDSASGAAAYAAGAYGYHPAQHQSPPQASRSGTAPYAASPPQAAAAAYGSPPRKQRSGGSSLPNPYGEPSEHGHDGSTHSPTSVYPPTDLGSHQGHGGQVRWQAPPSAAPPSYHTGY